ncbi:RNA polymerase sigma-70 factor [Sphingobacterium faecale]|uniref:RNA polymerase sigma-70 factor n=1 Tax=Sphingobacterium faecale TaxID=2803775 RepID=A0ABS1RAC8_9SPHI|nr:RNA polymerase sigma-70 factor [Sphingobacterium faecale]MBL1411495.1 RNA polymerase sigma-70 factor [Sphingobacterium faecale]
MSSKEFFLINNRLKDSDHNAFLEIYDTYAKALYHFVKKFIYDSAAIDDLVHDAFLNLWNARERIKPNYPIQNYLYKIARNLVYKRLKEQMRFLEIQGELAYIEEKRIVQYSVEETFIDAEYKGIYKSAVEQLPNQRRRIFQMSRQEGLSHKEIAERLGISINTVKEHMSLAMRSIQEYIAREHNILLKLLIVYLLS